MYKQYIPHYRVYIHYCNSDSSNVGQSYHVITIIIIAFIPDDTSNILLKAIYQTLQRINQFISILDYN